MDLHADKRHIFQPICFETFDELDVSGLTTYNENEQITQLWNFNFTSNMIETYPHSLVVFISGTRPVRMTPGTWALTFARTSRHNLSGTMDPQMNRTIICAMQEAILKFLEFVRSESFDSRWRKVIIVAMDSIATARLVDHLENNASNGDNSPATNDNEDNSPAINDTTERGRNEIISQKIKEIWIAKNGVNVEFWLVPKEQVMEPLEAASDGLGSNESSGQWQ